MQFHLIRLVIYSADERPLVDMSYDQPGSSSNFYITSTGTADHAILFGPDGVKLREYSVGGPHSEAGIVVSSPYFTQCDYLSFPAIGHLAV